MVYIYDILPDAQTNRDHTSRTRTDTFSNWLVLNRSLTSVCNVGGFREAVGTFHWCWKGQHVTHSRTDLFTSSRWKPSGRLIHMTDKSPMLQITWKTHKHTLTNTHTTTHTNTHAHTLVCTQMDNPRVMRICALSCKHNRVYVVPMGPPIHERNPGAT